MVWVSDQAPVVQKADSAIHRINHYPVDSQQLFFFDTYPPREIYPMDSAIQLLNDSGQASMIWHIPHFTKCASERPLIRSK